jgi:hypothetical protein
VAAIGGFLLATAVSWSVLVGVAGATTVGTPTISPTTPVQVGETLTVTNGAANPLTATITDQWLACATTTTTTCTAIAGATGLTYVVAASDIGKAIEVQETANDTLTQTPPNPATATSAMVLPPPPANSSAPLIVGVAQQGQPLMASPGQWSDIPSGTSPYTYQWTSNGAPISGQTGTSYIAGPGDVGKTIAVAVSATNAGGTGAPASSAPTAAVLPLPPTNSTPPTLTGTPRQGQVLTVTPGAWTSDPNNPTSITEQWQDCNALACTSIPGQNGTSYTVGAGDVGSSIQVVETAINAAAPSGVSATSGRTGTASTTSTTSVVAFTQNGPTTNQGVTLIATVTSNSPNANPHGSLSFFDGSAAISGCAGMPVNGGQTITVACQASFGAGTAQVSAAYVADPTSLVTGSSSSATPLGVGKGGTSVLLAVTPKVAPGGSATYLATLMVPASNAGPRLPGGSIEFLDGGQPIGTCASQSLSNLTATCTVSYKSPGTHTISALYTGDANFTGSTSSTSGVQIVKGAPKKPTVHGSLGSTVGWMIYYHPRYSEFTVFKVFAVAKGTRIIVHCYGKDCPFAKWSLAKPSGTLSLLRRLRHRHLRAGTRITVRLIRTHWFGWYYSFTMRAGRAPLTKRACIAPGTLKPGCTSRHR